MRKYYVVLAAILVGCVFAIIGTTPQAPQPRSLEQTAFSAGRAMEHVRIIAAEPHPTGSEANAQVRAYLVEQITAMGGGVLLPEGPVPDASLDRFGRWSGTRPDALTLTNVIGIFPGTERSEKAIALMAHHDTVYGSPGAADDSVGVAAILETVRAIRAAGDTRRDIVMLLTDGEELGLLGARQFFEQNPLADRVGALINLEARGGGGRTTLFQTSRGNGDAIKLYAGAVGRPGGSSLATFVYEALPNDTDLTPALERDYVAYNLSFIGRPDLYHSPKATPDGLDQGALQDMGDQTLALTRALADAEQLPGTTKDRTFFDFLGLYLIHYGTVAGWALLAAVVVLHLLCIRADQGARKGAVWWQRIAASGIVLVLGGGALFLMNLLSGAASGENQYYDRLAAIPMLEAQALLVCVAALAITAPWWAGRSGSIIGIAVAAAMQIVAPTTSFLVIWPLLFAGLIGVLRAYMQGSLSTVLQTILAAAALGMLLQFGHQFMQGVGPDLPSVVALLAMLAIPVLGPLMPEVQAKRAAIGAAAALGLAAAIALFVRFDAEADTVPVYDSMKG